MSTAVAEMNVPVAETEAYQVLMARLGRRTGAIPADLLVRHVLRCVPAHEWPTRVEAADALLRGSIRPARTICGLSPGPQRVGCWAFT